MAIAIRMDATRTSLKAMVDRYAREGRAAVTMRCAEPGCGQEYLVYCSSAIGEAALREGFAPYLERDHPNHPVLYEIDERAAVGMRGTGLSPSPSLPPNPAKGR